MSELYCPNCNSDKKLGVIKHEIITINSESNIDKHNVQLPVSMDVMVKCFDCGHVFPVNCSLNFEFNPF